MRRIILATLAVVMVVAGALTPALTPAPTAHADDWCWGDPIVMIGGKTVNINIGVQGTWSQVAAHVSNAHTKIYLPQDVTYSVVAYLPAPFTETVEFIPVSWLSSTSQYINVKIEVSFTRKTSGYRLAGVYVVQNGVTIGDEDGRTDGVMTESFKVKK